ncbi:Alpha/beta hydrolase family protein [compost metagenome]
MGTVQIKTDKGYFITACIFEAKDNHTVLVISSATGVKQSYYRKFSEFITNNGITVITFDYSGIGHSLNGPIKKNSVKASDWGTTDLEAVMKYAKEHYPGAAINLLGHSIGGQLIGLSKSAVEARKIILMAAQTGYWRFWTGFRRYRMWTNWNIGFPMLLYIFGYLPSKKITGMENLPKNVARQWCKWCLDPDYLFGDIPEQNLYFKNISAQLTSFSIADDPFAPVKNVDWLTEKYSAAKVKRLHLIPDDFGMDQIGHFGVFQEKSRANIWEILLKEIEK